MKKKIEIMIIGGTGFIGYHLAKTCIKKKWKVSSLSKKKSKKKKIYKRCSLYKMRYNKKK